MISGILTIGEASRALATVAARAPSILHELVQRLSIRAQIIAVRKVSGEVLNVRTGRLRRSINQIVLARGSEVTGIVSTPVEYAPPHEYGFKGQVPVAEHLRTIKAAFGRSIAPKSITVRAHLRSVELPERSFLRTALRELETTGAIDREVARAVKDIVA